MHSQRQQLIKAGRDNGVVVDIEGDGYYNIIDSYLDGHTNVEHSISVANYYDDLTLDETGNHPRARSKFYWELADYKGIDWNEAWAEP